MFESPKRGAETSEQQLSFAYDYYAAFSHSFVAATLSKLALGREAVVMDPWNGRGTTTASAAALGLTSYGFDLNPAMIPIARARLAPRDLVLRVAQSFHQRFSIDLASVVVGSDDGLLKWLQPSSVASIRAIKASIRHACQSIKRSSSSDVENTRAFFDVVLCALLRESLAPFRTSNPSWLRQRVASRQRLRPSSDYLARAFLERIAGFDSYAGPNENLGKATIVTGDSKCLPLPDNFVSATVGSPPYCTRIDYAIATGPELFLLADLTVEDVRVLREKLLGTTAITPSHDCDVPMEWGCECANVLTRIESHTSKASKTYYLRTYVQYFEGLFRSLGEIDRVSRPGADVVLVVQDSYYKDVHVSLSQIVCEMAESLDWQFREKVDHVVQHTIAGTNPSTRKYRRSFSAVESVLRFSV